MAPPSRRPPAMTARSNGAARGVTRSEETWASPPTESPGKVLSPRIARARAGDREACDETTRGTRPETRTRAPVRQAGVRARRDVWPMWARAEVLRQLACRLPICDKKLQRVFCPYEYRLPGLRPSIFLCFLHTGKQSANTRFYTSARHKFSHAKRRRTLASPFPSRRVARLRSRRAGTGRLPGGGRVSRSREPRFRARDRAHPPIAARGVLVLPSRDRGTAAQSPPLSSADARCVRVGATKWRAAPPPKRCDTERPSAVARPHPRLATRAPSRPRDARRRCPDSIRPPNGSPRRPNVSTSKEVEEFRARETPRP